MELSNETFLHGEKYKILSKISQGNFGITYLAEQTSLDRKVCIKEFFFRGFCERNSDGSVTISTSGQQVANSFRHKFMREAKRLSKFDHTNIVKVNDVFEENGTAYMVMDYVEGETLQQLVDRKGNLTEKEALDYIIPLCDALEVVHEKGLLHLDIKPSNILIKKQNNTPVLIDFGISKFTEASGEDHSTTTPVALTKGYAPLEQYGQDLAKLTALTDVYSVAATLYKLVTGVTPPEAAVIVQDGLKPPKEINPLLSGQLNSIILQSLSVKPNHRALSISKLKADLKGISNQKVGGETGVDKNKPIVVQETDGETEVLIGTNSDPSKPFKVGSTGVKKPKPVPKPNNSIPLWLLFSAVAIVILIFYGINSNTTPNAGNEAGKTEVQSSPSISKADERNSYSTVTDIDGNVYNTVKIGNQVWMVEDLKVIHYRNGDPIHNIKDGLDLRNFTIGVWCYNTSIPVNDTKYGNLYNWFAVSDSRNIAPEGWHIPTYIEWTDLITYLGGASVAGGKLKETGIVHWKSPNAGATNETRFSALPGGARTGIPTDIVGHYGSWWSSSEYNLTRAWFVRMYNENNQADIFNEEEFPIFGGKNYKKYGFSIRCIRD